MSSMELPQLQKLEPGFIPPGTAPRPLAPYDEAVLSKFHRGAGDLQSSSNQFLSPLPGYPKTSKDEEQPRYYRLTMEYNAYKNWYRQTKPEAYFDHLDIPPMPIKTEPGRVSDNFQNHREPQNSNLSNSRQNENTSNVKVFSTPIIGFDSNNGSNSNNNNNNSNNNTPVSTNNNSNTNVNNDINNGSSNNNNSNNNGSDGGSGTGRGIKRQSETDIETLESNSSQDSSHKIQRTTNGNPTRSFLVPPPAFEEEQPIIPMAERNIDRDDVYFTILRHPLKHQVKEFNILPATVLQLMRHYQNSSSSSDYVLVKLVCDPRMAKASSGDIFLTAISTHYSQNNQGEIAIPSLKVSQKMLPGRTKGFVFRLVYELHIDGKVVQSEYSSEFFIWSNVNQKGYPRKERDQYISQRIESNKKKTKPKKHPGRPSKKRSSQDNNPNLKHFKTENDDDDDDGDIGGEGDGVYEENSE